jgi:hypothetical protein
VPTIPLPSTAVLRAEPSSSRSTSPRTSTAPPRPRLGRYPAGIEAAAADHPKPDRRSSALSWTPILRPSSNRFQVAVSFPVSYSSYPNPLSFPSRATTPGNVQRRRNSCAPPTARRPPPWSELLSCCRTHRHRLPLWIVFLPTLAAVVPLTGGNTAAGPPR